MRPPYVADGTATDYFYAQGLTFSFLWMIYAGGNQPDVPTSASNGAPNGAMHTTLSATRGGQRHQRQHEEQQHKGGLASHPDGPQRAQGQHLMAMLGAEGGGGLIGAAQAQAQQQQRQEQQRRAQEVLQQRMAQRAQDTIVLALEGTLGNGALYDPIYDCIKYFNPLTRAAFEPFVARWIDGIYLASEYFAGPDGLSDFRKVMAEVTQIKEGSSTASAHKTARVAT